MQIMKEKKEQEERNNEKNAELLRRQSLLSNQFPDWLLGKALKVDANKLKCSIMSFVEVVDTLPVELQTKLNFPVMTDQFATLEEELSVDEYTEFMNVYAKHMPSDVFNCFMNHLKTCAHMYKNIALSQSNIVTLMDLFDQSDHSAIGLLDRHRILYLLERYWDAIGLDFRKHLRNPRRWPVVELGETENLGSAETLDVDSFDYFVNPEMMTRPHGDSKLMDLNKPKGNADEHESEKGSYIDEISIKKSSLEVMSAQSEVLYESRRSSYAADSITYGTVKGTEGDKEPVIESEVNTNENARIVNFISDLYLNYNAINSQQLNENEDDQTINDEVIQINLIPTSSHETVDKIRISKDEEIHGHISEDDKTLQSNEALSEEQHSSAKMNDIVEKETDVKEARNVEEESEGLNKVDSAEASDQAYMAVLHMKKYSQKKSGLNVGADIKLALMKKRAVTLTSQAMGNLATFDENFITMSQFIQLFDTFLGKSTPHNIFVSLVNYLHESYEETEEERTNNLLKIRSATIDKNRKVVIDSLFEKWDNDASGFLDFTVIDAVFHKYKEGLEIKCYEEAKKKLMGGTTIFDNKVTKDEFCMLFTYIVNEIPGTETFYHLSEFVENSIELPLSEVARGEMRKKWLSKIVRTAECSTTDMDPVYKCLFTALIADAETYGGNKQISASISMLERVVNENGKEVVLRYVATTPDDASLMLGQILRSDSLGISFSSLKSGNPIYVPRVSSHGNIYFWNKQNQEEGKDGSFIAVPLKDRRKRAFGILGIDTIKDPNDNAYFVKNEIHFYQGITKAFSVAFHHVFIRKKLLRITQSAICWMQRRVKDLIEYNVYLIEPNQGDKDVCLRKMLIADNRGYVTSVLSPPKLERNSNLFREYLFTCVDTSMTITTDVYNERHIAIPLRDSRQRSIAIIDLNIGANRRLVHSQNRELQWFIRLLQKAYVQVTNELVTDDDSKLLLFLERVDDDAGIDICFDRLMLEDIRDRLIHMEATVYLEMSSCSLPIKAIVDLFIIVFTVVFPELLYKEKNQTWDLIKAHINFDLIKAMADYDPTVPENFISQKYSEMLKELPRNQIMALPSSLPSLVYNWLSVCCSLTKRARSWHYDVEMMSLLSTCSEATKPIVQSSTLLGPIEADSDTKEGSLVSVPASLTSIQAGKMSLHN